MRIVLLTPHYSTKMGYIENALPKALMRLGAEVHVVTSRLKPYHWLQTFEQTYGGFTNVAEQTSATEELEAGFRIHYLQHGTRLRRVRLLGLFQKLRSLKPDIVQSFETSSWLEIEAALAKPVLGYKLFTGCHTAVSVFPLARDPHPLFCTARIWNYLGTTLPGVFVNLFSHKCYGAAQGCADIAVRFFGVSERKVDVSPLGVDTDIFFPVANEEAQKSRLRLRHDLGLREEDIVCIYTGRFAEDKNPLLLARAISCLVTQRLPFRALFVGEGVQADRIKALPGCVVHPFVPFRELGRFMRAADIGVWPTQESTSMLDAAACGLPVVVNHTMGAMERIAGNGLTYRVNDVEDLVSVLLRLRDCTYREKLGKKGAERMSGEFSWMAIAKRRLDDYMAAVGNG